MCVSSSTPGKFTGDVNLLESFTQFLRHYLFEHTGVEPTNNLAERQLRPLVISKKLSFGCDSTRGARFIERIFTAFMTCAQQGKNVIEFLNATIANYFANKPFQQLIAVPLPE